MTITIYKARTSRSVASESEARVHLISQDVCWKWWVLRWALKDAMEGANLMSIGDLFQMIGAADWKALTKICFCRLGRKKLTEGSSVSLLFDR